MVTITTTEVTEELQRRADAAAGVYTPFTPLVVKDGSAVYSLELSDRPDLPGTHKVTGRHGVTYGFWTEKTGRLVRIRRMGWFDRFGVLGTFDTMDAPTPGSDAPTMRVKGWASLR